MSQKPVSPKGAPPHPLLRKGSHVKMQLKEKIVQIYEAFFRGEDPSTGNANFWDELFLLKVNHQYLEGEFEKLTGEKLVSLKETINHLFYKSVETLKEENPIRVGNALQTICALIRGVFKHSSVDYGFDVINLLVGFDHAESVMQTLIGHLDDFIIGQYPMQQRTLSLQVLLVLVTATDNVSQNTMLEYVMINSVFETIIQILGNPVVRQSLGHDAILLLTLLVQYRKYESANPYIVKLSILDDELALNGYAQIISSILSDFNRQYQQKNAEPEGGFFTALTSMVGSMFVAEDKRPDDLAQGNDAILLTLYEAIHLNRNFNSTLTQSHAPSAPQTPPASPTPTSTPTTPTEQAPSLDVATLTEPASQPTNLLVTFLEYSSIIMQDIKHLPRYNNAKLCLVILTCVAEDQYANSLMHDVNMNFRVPLHKTPMRHRKMAPVDKKPPSRPLASALLGVWRILWFSVCYTAAPAPGEIFDVNPLRGKLHQLLSPNLQDTFIGRPDGGICDESYDEELPIKSLGVIHRVLCYQKKCRVRLQYPWKQLWTALINLLKFMMAQETHLLKKYDVFVVCCQVVNIFNLFITYGDTFLPNPTSYDELYYELIRMHQIFDNLYSMALRYTTTDGQWKDSAVRLTNTLVNIRAIINHFTPKVDQWAAANSLSTLTEDQVLEVVRTNYESLTLKLQDSLDQYERYSEKPKETAFFTTLVRHMIGEVRKNVLTSHQQQHSMLQEFSTLS